MGTPVEEQPPTYKRLHVLGAIACYILNACFDFSALAFITISVDGCATALNIPLNALLAYFCLGEVMTRRQFGACMVIITGALLAVTQGSHASSDLSLHEVKALWIDHTWLYFVAGLCAFHFFLACCVHRHVQSVHTQNMKSVEFEEHQKRISEMQGGAGRKSNAKMYHNKNLEKYK